MKARKHSTPGGLARSATRIWLPLAIAAAGVVLIVLGHARVSTNADSHSLQAGIGVGLLIVALIVWMISWMFRLSLQSNRDREVEEEAREYFDRHGHWPDEDA